MRRPESIRTPRLISSSFSVAVGLSVPVLAACVIADAQPNTDSASSTDASNADATAGSGESTGRDTDDASGEGTALTASEPGSGDDTGDTGSASSGSTASVEDDTGDTGPACDPAEITEVRGCDAPVGEGFCSEGAEHVPEGSDVAWAHDPPHSGPHYPSWELWGEHDATVPRGNWVHNLEHGGIVLAYRCAGDCDTELDVLRSVITERPDLRILLTPDPMLPGPRFAAISWTWIYEFDAPDLATLLCFVDQHENHAPEDVP